MPLEYIHTSVVDDWKNVHTKHNLANKKNEESGQQKQSHMMKTPAFIKLSSRLSPRAIDETTPNRIENLPTTEPEDVQTTV